MRWEPGIKAPRPKWTLESAASINENGVPPLEWDVEGLLPSEDGPAIIFGPPGALKSWIGLEIARCSVTGNPFLGRFAVRKRSHAIYVNLDAGRNSFARRVLRIGAALENLLIASAEAYDADALEQVMQDHPDSFVVIDCLADAYHFQRGDDSAESMRRFIRNLRAVFERHDGSGILLDHPHRPRDGEPHGDYYGSIQKEAAARTMLFVKPLHSGEEHVASAQIDCRKMNEAEAFESFVVRFDFNETPVTATCQEAPALTIGPATSIVLKEHCSLREAPCRVRQSKKLLGSPELACSRPSRNPAGSLLPVTDVAAGTGFRNRPNRLRY
jgi:hypothetical protein